MQPTNVFYTSFMLQQLTLPRAQTSFQRVQRLVITLICLSVWHMFFECLRYFYLKGARE